MNPFTSMSEASHAVGLSPKPARRSWLVFVLCAAVFSHGNPAGAATITWADAGTDFATNANWLLGTAPANSIVTDIASFGLVVNSQPNLALASSVNGLAFTAASTNAVTFTGAVFTIGTGGINNASASGLKLINNNLVLGAAQSYTNNGAMTIAGTVTNGGFLLTLTGTGATGTVSGAIGGTGGLTKTGTGTWIVSGNNNYSGGTTVSTGVLNIQHNNALGTTGAGTTVASGAALQLQGNITVTGENLTNIAGTGVLATGALRNISGNNTWTGGMAMSANTTIGSDAGLLTFSGNITNFSGNRTLTVTGAGDTTITGALSNGSGGIIKTGAGKLILSGTNTYTGATRVNGGTLQLGSSSSLANSALTINATTASTTALVDLNGFNATITSLTFGTAFLGVASTNNLSTGAGTLTLGGNVTYNASGNPFGSTLSGKVALGAATRTFTIGDSTNAPVDLTVSADISGAVGLIKAGAGTMVLSGNNSYTGVTTINAGTLSINTIGNVSGGASALGAPTTAVNGTIAIGTGATGATLQYTGSGSTTDRVINLAGTTGGATLDSSGTGALAFTSNITATGAGSKTLTLAGSNTSANTISGTIVNNSGANTTSLVKSGAGTWTLSGVSANTYTGTTAINDGTLNLNKTAGVNALGTGAGTVTIGDGVGSASTANLVLQASNQIADSTAITINSDGRLSLGTFSEAINTVAGSGLIDLGASGALTVNASSTFSGKLIGAGSLTVAGGTFTLGSSLGIPPNDFTGTLNLGTGTTLALNGFNFTMGTLHITGNSILDFGNSAASVLDLTNLIIDAGVLLTVNNWVDAVDFFNVQNDPGGSQGNNPLNQILFTGGSYTINDTRWQPYDRQITPAPEPATYGAILAGISTLLLAWRRRRRVVV